MSISKVFYALIDDKGATFQSAEFKSDHIIFRARLRKKTKKCPCCQSFDVRIKETKERTFRMVNLGKNINWWANEILHWEILYSGAPPILPKNHILYPYSKK